MPIIGPGQPGHDQLVANAEATRQAQQEHNERFGLVTYDHDTHCPWCHRPIPYGKGGRLQGKPIPDRFPAHATPDQTDWCPGSLRSDDEWLDGTEPVLDAVRARGPVEMITTGMLGTRLHNNLPERCPLWVCLCAVTARTYRSDCTGRSDNWPWTARPDYSARPWTT